MIISVNTKVCEKHEPNDGVVFLTLVTSYDDERSKNPRVSALSLSMFTDESIAINFNLGQPVILTIEV